MPRSRFRPPGAVSAKTDGSSGRDNASEPDPRLTWPNSSDRQTNILSAPSRDRGGHSASWYHSTHTHAHALAHAHANAHTRTHTRAHARAHTRTHGHTHTHMHRSFLRLQWISLALVLLLMFLCSVTCLTCRFCIRKTLISLPWPFAQRWEL